MARRIQQTQTTTVNTTENKSELFMNLGFLTKEGKFIRLSNSVVITADKLVGETKNISNNETEWAKDQKIRNLAIKEIQEIFDSLEKGESCMLSDFDTKALGKLTFQFHKVGDKPETSEQSFATDKDLEDLL